MTTYRPIIGSVAERVIKHLKALPPGAEQTGAELAEAIKLDTHNLGPYLAVAEIHGVVKARLEKGAYPRRRLWSLGDGTPKRKVKDQPLHQVPDKVTAPASVFDLAKEEPKPAPTTEPAPKPKQSRGHFRAGLFSDGTLVIEVGSNEFRLEPDHVETLTKLLKVTA